MKIYFGIVFSPLFFVFLSSCEDSTSPQVEEGVFSGKVLNRSNDKPVYPVYIFKGYRLLAVLEQKNNYVIELEHGEHELMFSAIGYLDEIVAVSINGNTSKEI